MTWNFCPWCSHRVYQHNDEGCLHVDLQLVECTDPDCQPDVIVVDGTHAHERPVRCGCKHPHPLLIDASIAGYT